MNKGEILACITTRDSVGTFPTFQVLCHDGTHTIEIKPADPHTVVWFDYQEAYDALWAVYPHATLIGPENWFLTVRTYAQQETGEPS